MTPERTRTAQDGAREAALEVARAASDQGACREREDSLDILVGARSSLLNETTTTHDRRSDSDEVPHPDLQQPRVAGDVGHLHPRAAGRGLRVLPGDQRRARVER